MIFKDISDCLSQLRLRFGEESVAAWAEERDIGQETLCEILSFLKEVSKKKDSDAEAFLRKTSRLPSSSVRSFSNFDFTPFGDDARRELCALASLSFLSTGRNVVFIGPTGVGKTHLAQAIGGEACKSRVKTYYTTLYELDQRMTMAIKNSKTQQWMNGMTMAKCLIIDEFSNCHLGKANTELFFHLVNTRYGSDKPGAMILTSNNRPSAWKDLFTGEDLAECIIDRILDKAIRFDLNGPSYRGKEKTVFRYGAVETGVSTVKKIR